MNRFVSTTISFSKSPATSDATGSTLISSTFSSFFVFEKISERLFDPLSSDFSALTGGIVVGTTPASTGTLALTAGLGIKKYWYKVITIIDNAIAKISFFVSILFSPQICRVHDLLLPDGRGDI